MRESLLRVKEKTSPTSGTLLRGSHELPKDSNALANFVKVSQLLFTTDRHTAGVHVQQGTSSPSDFWTLLGTAVRAERYHARRFVLQVRRTWEYISCSDAAGYLFATCFLVVACVGIRLPLRRFRVFVRSVTTRGKQLGHVIDNPILTTKRTHPFSGTTLPQC